MFKGVGVDAFEKPWLGHFYREHRDVRNPTLKTRNFPSVNIDQTLVSEAYGTHVQEKKNPNKNKRMGNGKTDGIPCLLAGFLSIITFAGAGFCLFSKLSVRSLP